VYSDQSKSIPVEIFDETFCIFDDLHDGGVLDLIADFVPIFGFLDDVLAFQNCKVLGCIRLIEVELVAQIIDAEIRIIDCLQDTDSCWMGYCFEKICCFVFVNHYSSLKKEAAPRELPLILLDYG
jgi:hypothetical protein